MKSLFILFLILISSYSFASTQTYDLKIDLSINGKHIASPRMIVKDGVTSSMTQDSDGKRTFIDVIATEQKSAILMKFVVGTISKIGEKQILSTPQILTVANEKAEVTVGNQKESSEMNLSVIARKKEL